MVRIRKSAWIEGHRLRLRNAVGGDAEFILGLRQDPARNAHLSITSPRLEDQRAWLAGYAADGDQAYFIIESLDGGIPLGTVRLYDARGDSFCWGSWMLVPAAPPLAAIESALMVYRYALDLGFRAAHFQVQRGNATVCRFHENFGARRVGEDNRQIHYAIDVGAIERSLLRYRRFLPGGIRSGPRI
ncbi:MAG: GNAT family N-acetyltransferase [Burkholderiales bacterium]|nr:GNAT family N-acetyltransferase [Burkholderiales bacterium]